MKDNRRKVFVISVLVFLLCGGGIFTFFVFKGVEDLKDKPNFAFEYSAFPKKMFFPVFKYLGIVDTEVVSSAGKKPDASKDYDASKDFMASAEAGDSNAASLDKSAPKNYSSQSSPYSPSAKMSAKISSPGSFAGGGSKTNQTTAFSSGSSSNRLTTSANKEISSDKAGETGKLLTQASGMKNLIQEGLKTGSSSNAKYKWDQSFAGSMSASKKGMYDSGGVKLDKIRGEVIDLKAAETKGLTAPEPGAPTVDENAKASDPMYQKAKDMASNFKNQMSNGMMNSMMPTMSGGSGNTGNTSSASPDANAFTGDMDRVTDEVNNWKFSSGENVTVTREGNVFTATYSDGFVVKMDGMGNVNDYYYPPPPNVETGAGGNTP